jgi:hypothetical protein
MNRPLETVLSGLFLACWLVLFLSWARWVPLAGHAPGSLYPFFSFAAALGWVAGTLYVQRGRPLAAADRRWLRWVYFVGPQGLAYLLRAMASLPEQRAAPFAPLWALGVYSIFFFVPLAVIRW